MTPKQSKLIKAPSQYVIFLATERIVIYYVEMNREMEKSIFRFAIGYTEIQSITFRFSPAVLS